MCDIFTRSQYVWVDVNGNRIDEWKEDAWKHMKTEACKDKIKIKAFLDNLDYTVRGFCNKCNKYHRSKFKKYVDEAAIGDDNCPICDSKLFYI